MLTIKVVHEQHRFYYLIKLKQKIGKFSVISKFRSEIGQPIFLTFGIGRYRSATFWKMTSLVRAAGGGRSRLIGPSHLTRHARVAGRTGALFDQHGRSLLAAGAGSGRLQPDVTQRALEPTPAARSPADRHTVNGRRSTEAQGLVRSVSSVVISREIRVISREIRYQS